MNQTQIKNYYKSDIFHLNEEKKNLPKKSVRTGKCLYESGKQPEKEIRPQKKINRTLLKETTQKEWNVKRMRPEKRKADSNNTLAYDLSNQPVKFEKTQKRMIKEPYSQHFGKKGKKIMIEKSREDPGNTLAYH